MSWFSSKKKEAPSGAPKAVQYVAPFPLEGDVHIAESHIYKLFCPADHAHFITLCDSMDGWTLRHDNGDVYCWDKKVPGENFNMIRVFGTFPDISPDTMNDVLHDPVYRGLWDENRIEAYRIASLDHMNDVGYYSAKVPSPVSNRDFVNQRGWMRHGPEGTTYTIFNTSVPFHTAGEKKGFVRATSKVTGYYVRPFGNGGCSLTYISLSDPKGWIPTAFVNMITTRLAPQVMGKLGSACRGYDKWIETAKEHDKDWICEAQSLPCVAGHSLAPVSLHQWLAQHKPGAEVVAATPVDEEVPPLGAVGVEK